jgi:hypothetical protein
MSTRGGFTFIDADKATFHVYKHHDTYPEGAWGGPATLLLATRYAWQFPRFEADEFAASFITAAKMSSNMTLHMQKLFDLMDQRAALKPDPDPYKDHEIASMITVPPAGYSYTGGGVRLLGSGLWQRALPEDCAFHYVVQQRTPGGEISAECASLGWGENDKRTREVLYKGNLIGMAAWGMRLKEIEDEKRKAAEEAAKQPKFRARPARMLL